MTYIYFIVLYFLLGWSALQNLWLITIALSIVFTLQYGGLFLIPVAMAIDGYFGAFATFPFFSFIALGWYTVSELVRPHVRML